MTDDVLEDTIVFGLQTVDGHDNREARNAAPLRRDLPHGAGHQLHEDPALRQQREQRPDMEGDHT
jgi:hypothetical protein